jgi:hypothetical protein
MSLDRQEASLYKPLRKVFFATASLLQQLVTSPRAAIRSLLTSIMNGGITKGGITGEDGVIIFIFLTFLVVIVFLVRKVAIWLRVWLAKRGLLGGSYRPRAVEFYERFQRMANAKGLKRAPQQTQEEFAEIVASAYSPELAAFGLVDLPSTVSRMFYRVRFGDEELSQEENIELNDLLGKLELAFSDEPSRSLV